VSRSQRKRVPCEQKRDATTAARAVCVRARRRSAYRPPLRGGCVHGACVARRRGAMCGAWRAQARNVPRVPSSERQTDAQTQTWARAPVHEACRVHALQRQQHLRREEARLRQRQAAPVRRSARASAQEARVSPYPLFPRPSWLACACGVRFAFCALCALRAHGTHPSAACRRADRSVPGTCVITTCARRPLREGNASYSVGSNGCGASACIAASSAAQRRRRRASITGDGGVQLLASPCRFSST
jgi:hypothetical protein